MSSNIEVKLDVLNQKGSPALFADSLASRPAASFAGRLFVDTDNPSTGIYRDTGTTWIQVADETGTIPTPTLQTVTTAGNTSNVGISISANGIGIGTTIPASNRLDIHTATGINATFNGTGTTNSALQLQSAGVGKWTIQNNYNSAANDFVLTDVLNTVNRLVIKNTGLATYTGFLNVANIASAQNIQISGTAPAYSIIDVAGSGYGSSLGMATIANNFIQGSVLGDLCLVNQNTGGGNVKFAVGSANVATINISTTNRVQIGTSTDAGYKLDVNGTTRLNSQTTITGSTTASGALAQGIIATPTLVAAANSDVLVGLDINPTFTNGAFTGVTNYAARFSNNILGNGVGSTSRAFEILLSKPSGTIPFIGMSAYADGSTQYISFGGQGGNTTYAANYLYFYTGATTTTAAGTRAMAILPSSNINIGSSITDAGYKLDVNGTLRANTTIRLEGTTVASFVAVGGSADNKSLFFANTGQAGNVTRIYNYGPTNLFIIATGDGTGSPTDRFAITATGNVLINTATDVVSSKFTIASTTQGFLPPRMTTTQKNAIATPATGLVVYDTTLNKLALYTGAAWETVTSI